uniref:Uncharacterized protein n=1 Tax=Rhynchosporium secalis TaxID=38038 RepID=V5W610_RHYSE|nr:hypothetical protein [Rhynchosporium secalis]AHC02453.1 hypothetical protein [Rhynchosporium secalis]
MMFYMIILLSILLLSNNLPSLLKAEGKSTADPAEVESNQKKLETTLTELKENEAEREKVNEQNNYDGDTGSPNEVNSADELEQWDEVIKQGKKTIVDLVNWLAA